MKIIGNNKQLFEPCRGKHHCPRNVFAPMCVIAAVGKCFPEVNKTAPKIVHPKIRDEQQHAECSTTEREERNVLAVITEY
ncbi:hypothetical protein GQ457_03G013820 [Hibiscus cannabinus]